MFSPVLNRMIERHGMAVVDDAAVDQFAQDHTFTALFFPGDWRRLTESDDVAVILPELVQAFQGVFKPAVIANESQRRLQARYAVIAKAAALIGAGRILAIKGIGGFHLTCNAADEAAVNRLRSRKKRDGKPFALMARDLGQIAEFVHLSDEERKLLASSAAPVVLMRRRAGGRIAAGVAPRCDRLGFMLP